MLKDSVYIHVLNIIFIDFSIPPFAFSEDRRQRNLSNDPCNKIRVSSEKIDDYLSHGLCYTYKIIFYEYYTFNDNEEFAKINKN